MLSAGSLSATARPVVSARKAIVPVSPSSGRVAGALAPRVNRRVASRKAVGVVAFKPTDAESTSETSSAAKTVAPVCVVTGAARGIGYKTAEALAATGAKLVIIDLKIDDAGPAAEKLAAEYGIEASGFGCNVADHEAVGKVFEQIVEEFGTIDVLVNNAGITRDMLMSRLKPEDWKLVLDVNLSSAFFCTQAACKIMGKKRSGRIINLSSVVGVHGNMGQANYSASKAGLIGLTKTAAREYAGKGVMINAIAPGFIATPMTDALSDKVKGTILDTIPMKRMGDPEEVADLITWLATGKGSGYITGQVIPIDGGLFI